MHRRSASSDDNQALQRLKDERDAAVQQTKQLQKELEIIKNQRSRKSDRSTSIGFALFVGLIGMVGGWLAFELMVILTFHGISWFSSQLLETVFWGKKKTLLE